MSHLVSGSYQVSLFEDVNKTVNLYKAMDHLRDKFGERSVVRASGMEAKRIGRGNPFTGKHPPLLANRRQ